jgi:hypothetical protein
MQVCSIKCGEVGECATIGSVVVSGEPEVNIACVSRDITSVE